MVRNVGATEEGSPILVHCSAGLGRSGVFVAVHCALEAHANGQRVDVETTVREMRKQREKMVQTPEQYRFIYEALVEALDPLPSEEIPRSESETVRRPVTKAPTVVRPFSQPPQDQDTPRTKRKKLYLQHNIPPPPSYPPPEEKSKGEGERESSPPLAEIASPPPPTSSPPLEPSDQELVRRKLDSLKEEKEGGGKEEEEREHERQHTDEAATATATGKAAKRPSKEGGKREPERSSQKRSAMRGRKEETVKEERPLPAKERPTAHR